jgi:hypothetical protein
VVGVGRVWSTGGWMLLKGAFVLALSFALARGVKTAIVSDI